VSYSQNVWNQLKNLTADDLISALIKDGWVQEEKRGATQAYRKEDKNGQTINRVTIHRHPKSTYGAKLLKGLLSDIGWSEDELRKLKLIR